MMMVECGMTEPTATQTTQTTQVIHKTPSTFTAEPLPLSIAAGYNYLKILLLGQSGKGKTRSVCNLPKWMYPLALLDIDRKASSMTELAPLRKAGLVDVYDVDAPLIEEGMGQRARSLEAGLTQMPKGLIQVVDLTNFITKLGKHKTIMYDSESHLADHVVRTVEYIYTGKDTAWGQDWKKTKTLHDDFVSSAVKRASTHVIMTCHVEERIKRSGKGSNATESRSWAVLIDGAFKDKLMSYFNEAYFFFSKVMTGGVLGYFMQTKATDKVPARSSIAGLPMIMEQNLKLIGEVWRGQMEGVEMGNGGEGMKKWLREQGLGEGEIKGMEGVK
jgi:hypothetical protein